MKRHTMLPLLSMIGLSLIFALSCTLPEFPDTTPPTVTIIYPAPDAVVTGQVEVVASSTDDNSVEIMKIFIDGEERTAVEGDGLRYMWDTTPIADNQDHYIMATAADKEGNIGYSDLVPVRVTTGASADTLAPVVSIIYPAGGSSFTGVDTITVVADASDPSGIKKVEFYIDGFIQETDTSAPYTYDWPLANYKDGLVHTIYVKGYDSGDNTGSDFITVIINP